MTAAFCATLRRNAADFCAGRLRHETFDDMQRATWDAIRGAGPRVECAVLRALRAR